MANRNVLRFFLIISKLLLSFIWLGNLFQSVGPATLKGLDAKVCLTVLGITSLSFMLLHLKLCVHSVNLTSGFVRYSGASPLRHLNTNTRILNCILVILEANAAQLVPPYCYHTCLYPVLVKLCNSECAASAELLNLVTHTVWNWNSQDEKGKGLLLILYMNP